MADDQTAPAEIKLKPPGDYTDDPITFIVEEKLRSDNRGVRVIERVVVSGVAPRGYERFVATMEFPFTDDSGRRAKKAVQAAVDASDFEEAFRKAMPLLVKAMDDWVKRMERLALAQQVREMAAAGGGMIAPGQGPKPR